MKKYSRLLLAICSMLLLVGCTISGTPAIDEGDIVIPQADPVKTQGNNNQTDPEIEGEKPENNTPEVTYDTWAVMVKVVNNEEEATEHALIYGVDEDWNTLWEYETPEQYVGQYNGICDMYSQENGYYVFADSSVYCINETTGQPNWICKLPHPMTGVVPAFDNEGNLYIIGPETTEMFGVNKNGEISYHIDEIYFNSEAPYWASYMEIVDGFAVITFDSDEVVRTINLETGSEDVFEVDLSIFTGNWEQISHEIEGDRTEGEAMSAFLSFFMEDDYYISVGIGQKYSDEMDYYFDMMPTIIPGYLYNSFEPSDAGTFYISFRGADNVYFDAAIDSNDQLVVFYYHDWEDYEYPSVSVYEYKRIN